MKRLLTITASLVILCSAPLAHAQTAPPAAPVIKPSPAPGASSSVTVTRNKRCVTVKVCPGTTAQPAPAPAPPPPPPVVRAPKLAPPPPVVACPRPVRVLQKPKRTALRDPANTRLAISNTAEVLGHGEWEVAGREIAGLLEVSVGLWGRFQLTLKTSPVTWFIPDLRFKDSLWAGELKVQLIRRSFIKLTADFSYFHVMDMHGIKTGISAKIGTDRVALHLGLGALVVFPPKMTADTCAGPVDSNGYEATDCGGGGDDDIQAAGVLLANVGLEARFWRYGKFFLDGFMAHFGDGGDGETLFALVPGVRFHGNNFAADLGLGILAVAGAKVPFPVINLSYRW